MQYSLYECQVDKLIHDFKQSTPRFKRKHLDDRGIMRQVIVGNREFTFTGTYHVIAEETHWEHNSSVIIFPENEHVITNLLNAKFSITSMEGFSLPYNSFSMAIPKGYRYNGIEIGGFLASFDKSEEDSAKKSKRYLDKYGLKITRQESAITDDPTQLTIASHTPGNLLNGIISISGSLALKLINCNSYEEFASIIKNSPQGKFATHISEQAFILLRIVMAVSVYDMATEHKRIIQGYPSATSKDIKHCYPNRVNTLFTLTAPQTKEEADGVKMHYRTWHFRQLRADRYYQGEYENHPKGSRYAFVSDTVVNRKVDAHTLVDESSDFV